MTIHVKVADGWHQATQPYVKTGASTWTPATKVFLKTGASTWTEVWPLVPGPPSGLTFSQPYRNDRIEIDFSWTAPSTGAPTIYYRVSVYIGGGLYNTYTITAPTVSMTLTDGDGFQNYAGQSIYFTVTPYSAGDRAGAMATSSTAYVPQLPAPPMTYSLANSLSDGNLITTWSHSGGNRLSGFTMAISFNGSGYYYYYYSAATSVYTTASPWNGAYINGGYWSVLVRADGPGGSSDWEVRTGAVPDDPSFTDVRFLSGYLRGTVWFGGNTTSTNTFFFQSGGSLVLHSTGCPNGYVAQPGDSINWPRDGSTQFGLAAQGVNSWGTSRVVYSGLVRKMPYPINIYASDANTWRGSGWRSDGSVYQGYTSNGMNYGHVFYENGFRDSYNVDLCGYAFTITSARMALNRAPGGYSGGIAPRLWLHKEYNIWEVDNQFDGGVDLSTIAINTYGWVDLPTDWLYYLRDQTNGWQGFGFFHPNTTVNPAIGTSNEYMRLYIGAIGPMGVYAFQVQVFHDG